MEQVAGVDDTPCVVDTAERNATMLQNVDRLFIPLFTGL